MSECHEQIAYTCPRCRAQVGRAYRFADGGSALVRVLIRCENCQHRWSEIIARPVTK